MAISFKSDADYGYSLLPLFGVSTGIIAHAKALGVMVDQTSPGSFVVRLDGVTYGSVTVKGTAISLAKQNTLGPASKEALKFQFEQALAKAIAAHTVDGLPSPAQPKKVVPASAFAQFIKPPKELVAPTPLDLQVAKPKASFKQAQGGVAVPLASATSVYAPVKGTTGGSVYYVFAMFKGLNVAARVSGSNLSVRAEGANLKSYMPALQDFGMDDKGGYSSGHYDAKTTDLLVKSLGAIVGRVGFENVVSVADLNLFVKG